MLSRQKQQTVQRPRSRDKLRVMEELKVSPWKGGKEMKLMK